METGLAILTGVLYAAGIYMMLRRSLVKLVIGLILLAHAANLLIFTSAGLTRDEPPLIPQKTGVTVPEGQFADPVPQALVLTAIVIGFGVLAFTVVLAHRANQETGADDVDDLRTTE